MNGLALRKPERGNVVNVNLPAMSDKIAVLKVDVSQFDFGMSESYMIK